MNFRATSDMPENMKVCRAKGSDPTLLLSNRAAIRRLNLITKTYEPLVVKLDSAVAMDFLHRFNSYNDFIVVWFIIVINIYYKTYRKSNIIFLEITR